MFVLPYVVNDLLCEHTLDEPSTLCIAHVILAANWNADNVARLGVAHVVCGILIEVGDKWMSSTSIMHQVVLGRADRGVHCLLGELGRTVCSTVKKLGRYWPVESTHTTLLM